MPLNQTAGVIHGELTGFIVDDNYCMLAWWTDVCVCIYIYNYYYVASYRITNSVAEPNTAIPTETRGTEST